MYQTATINQGTLKVTVAATRPITNPQRLLRARHQLTTTQADDFTIRNNNDILSRVSSVSQTMTLLLGSVAAVSLVVVGIGIMNIMLVSVIERTREIGIRLAIGAQPADVLTQFLVEAVVLSVLGGLIAILIGAGVALLLPIVAGWATVLPWNAIVLAFDPIVALRYE